LGGVFISYRREESAFAARAIYDRIAQKVGRENVFLDVDNIDLGVDWFQVLSEKVGACDALIAVIGKNWISRAGEDDFKGSKLRVRFNAMCRSSSVGRRRDNAAI
jgi:hypothetical protein